MPTRIIRDGIIDSARMEALVRDAGWGGECFYRRLHQVVDDYGRFDGRISVIRAKCYPTLLDVVRDADVSRWIAACEKSGLIRVYETCGQACLVVLDFRQRARTPSKYPEPPKIDCPPDVGQMTDKCSPYAKAQAQPKAQAQSPPPPEGETIQLPPSLDSPEFRSAWNDWAAHRREIRKPLKAQAIKNQLKALEAMGPARAVAAIRHSIAGSYQGIFEPRQEKSHVGTNPTRNPTGYSRPVKVLNAPQQG